MPSTSHTYESMRSSLQQAGQEHVLHYFDSLTTDEQTSLLAQLGDIDPIRVHGIFKTAMAAADVPIEKKGKLAALPDETLDSIYQASASQVDEWRTLGLKQIAKNQVAVLLMAGGQGTRLGSSSPKGCYDIGLPSHKSLFQLQGERIARAQVLAKQYTSEKVVIPWYVMTSGPTRAETEAFFKKHNFFGLDPAHVIFFEQGVLPALTKEGKFILETKSSLSVAPDGNGGVYPALVKSGVLADMEKRKITHIHAYCVDNCLVRVADPVFIGHAIATKSDCGVKVVRKEMPEEPVGLVVLRNNKPCVVEYSECDKATMELKSSKDANVLAYRAANIANHLFTLEFLQRITKLEASMEYHVAHKKIKHIDLSTGEQVSPKTPNGDKMELFVFDVFPLTNSLHVLEGRREDEFSPLKNAPGAGVDCPETSRRDIMSQHRRWLEQAGAKVQAGSDGEITVEIDPSVSYEGENLEKAKGKTYTSPLI